MEKPQTLANAKFYSYEAIWALPPHKWYYNWQSFTHIDTCTWSYTGTSLITNDNEELCWRELFNSWPKTPKTLWHTTQYPIAKIFPARIFSKTITQCASDHAATRLNSFPSQLCQPSRSVLTHCTCSQLWARIWSVSSWWVLFLKRNIAWPVKPVYTSQHMTNTWLIFDAISITDHSNSKSQRPPIGKFECSWCILHPSECWLFTQYVARPSI